MNNGLIERIFDLVTKYSLSLESHNHSKSATPSMPRLEEEEVCRCDGPNTVYSDLCLKLSLCTLLQLCDCTSAPPDAPLETNSVHVHVISHIASLTHEILCNHGLENINPQIAISFLFLQLVHHLREKILPVYEKWIEVSIEGVGHPSSKLTRKYFAQSLRTLVPLAPVLLRSLHWNTFQRSTATSHTSNLVGNVFLAQYPLLSERYLLHLEDPVVKREVSIKDQIASLDDASPSETRSARLSQLLRPYQLKGKDNNLINITFSFRNRMDLESLVLWPWWCSCR